MEEIYYKNCGVSYCSIMFEEEYGQEIYEEIFMGIMKIKNYYDYLVCEETLKHFPVENYTLDPFDFIVGSNTFLLIAESKKLDTLKKRFKKIIKRKRGKETLLQAILEEI